MNGEIVYINGEFFKPSEAKISVFDRGFLYGDGVYEVCRRYDGVFYALEDHIHRLFHSASRIGLDLQKSERDYMAEIYHVAHESGIENAYMRIIVTRGEAGINLDPTTSKNINCVIFMKPVEGMINLQSYIHGLEIITSMVERNHKKAMDPNIKSGNYLNNIMALGEAKKQNAYDAILVNREGNVTEGTTWNFYMVKNGNVITAPDDSDILWGITRAKIKKICLDNKIPYLEKQFTPKDVLSADEAFATGSVKEITPIKSLDGHLIGSGKPGPMTEKLMSLYKQTVQDYCDQWMVRIRK